jgi:type II secretory pathway pseudopilin PulG
MRTEAGFTLIEILSGGIISTVLAGAMLSLFYMVTGNIKESAANSRLLRIETGAQDQLRRTVRSAYGAKRSPGEPGGGIASIAANDANAYSGLSEIWLYEESPDALIGAYQVSVGQGVLADTLMEWSGGAFIPMRIGSDTVFLDHGTSSFSLFPNRRGVGFDLRYRILENGNTYSTSSLMDSVLCRAQL